jgi:hypothetical protein
MFISVPLVAMLVASCQSANVARNDSMFTLRSWTETQRALLTDRSYIGMKPGSDGHSVIACWREAGARSEQARRAIDMLNRRGIQVAQAIGSPTATEVASEADRVIEDRGGVRVYESGPNADGTGLEVTVAEGSFDDAARQGIDVLTRLDLGVPTVIDEGDQPLPAG